MNKLYRLLIVVCFVPGCLFAQDWQCIRPAVTASYVDTTDLTAQNAKNTMWIIHLDSVSQHQGWIYYYGYPTIRNINHYLNGAADIYCYNAFGPSRMGIAMSAQGGENYFFNSAGDGIRFSTFRQPNDPWICCRITDTTRLYATVIKTDMEEVMGVHDSVKYIMFQARDDAGKPVLHAMNSQIFKLSKHFGMITLYDFYTFPDVQLQNPFFEPVHILAGIDSSGTVIAQHNLTPREVYNILPGDIFHRYYGGYDPHYLLPISEEICLIQDTIWNTTHDSVTLKIDRYYHRFNGQPDGVHLYGRDTIFESYCVSPNEGSGLGSYPEQTVLYNDTSGVLTAVNSFSQLRTMDYNARWVKSKGKSFNKIGSYCADTLFGDIVGPDHDFIIDYYIAGCGGPYYEHGRTDCYHDYHSVFLKLVYFKKGTETWGTPIDTTSWGVPEKLSADTLYHHLRIFPNPVTETVTAFAACDKGACLKLVVFSLAGMKVGEYPIEPGEQTLSLANYSPGMYYAILYQDGKKIGFQKIAKY